MIFKSVIDYFVTEVFKVRIKPETIQLPITGNCNSKCLTCNIWKQKCRNDIDPRKLKKVLQDEYLSNVKYVGINGGEPFLHKEFEDVILSVLSLKKLKAIYLITNGLLTDRIATKLKSIKKMCDHKSVKLFLTISLDGIANTYERVRGVPLCEKVVNTLKMISENKDEYCSTLTIGTTISRWNVAMVPEIKALSKSLQIPVNYHLAVPNRRIYNEKEKDFSVFSEKKAWQLACELFYGLFKYSSGLKQKLLYFQNYYYLRSGGKRISGCNYKRKDLTIDENLNVYFCAKESVSIGNAENSSIREIIQSKTSKNESSRIMHSCDGCGHYITTPTVRGAIFFALELLKPAVWLRYGFIDKIRR